MYLIDSHCHLNRLKLGEQTLAQAVDEAHQAGVARLMTIMCDLDEYDELGQIVAQFADAPIDVGMSVGVHPCEDADMMAQATTEHLTRLASAPSVWAIGETGLDFHYSSDLKNAQIESLIRHIEVSNLMDKPIIIHAREAKDELLEVLRAHPVKQGILHCFTEDLTMANELIRY